MRARSTRRSLSFAAAAMALLMLLPIGCKPAPSASISGEGRDTGATTSTGRVTSPPTIVRPQGGSTTLSPAGEETSPSFTLPPTYHGGSPFEQDEASPSTTSLPQAALPTSQGPPR